MFLRPGVIQVNNLAMCLLGKLKILQVFPDSHLGELASHSCDEKSTADILSIFNLLCGVSKGFMKAFKALNKNF